MNLKYLITALLLGFITIKSQAQVPSIDGQQSLPMAGTEDTQLTITLADLLVTDADNVYPDDFTLTVLPGTNYSVAGTTITPATNFVGTLSVSVKVNDGTNDSNIFPLDVLINAVNDKPIITGQTILTTSEEQDFIVLLSHLTVTDPDNVFPNDFTLSVQNGTNYTVVGNTVTPDVDFNGILSIPVTVNDGTIASDIFTLQLHVTPVNDAPIIIFQNAVNKNEDQAFQINVTDLIISDPDNTYPTDFSVTVNSGINFTVLGNTITPDPDFNGTLQVPVTVSDGSSTSNVFNVSVTILPVNDKPVIVSADVLSISEDSPLAISISNVTATDVDNTFPADFTLSVVSGSNYTFVGNTITPAANFTGTLSVQVVVNDGAINSDPFGITVNVSPINDKPVITGQSLVSTLEDQALTILLSNLTVSDPDNAYPSGFTLSVTSGPNYSVSGNTITPSSNFNGTLTVPVSVNDGSLSSDVFNMTVQVISVNDKPVITGQQVLSTPEDQSLLLNLANLTVTDIDNAYPTGFTLIVLAGANYTFSGTQITPALNFNGTLSVNVRVNDGIDNSATFPLVVSITPVNDIPVITGQASLSILENQPLTISLAHLTVSDPDNVYPTDFSLTVQNGSNYTVAGTTITPNTNYNGTLSVPVKVNDGSAFSALFNLVVIVNSVNSIPVITGQQSLSVAEDNSITLSLSNLTVTDADNPYPTGFSFFVTAGSNYTFTGTQVTPAPNFNGTLTVSVHVNDGTDNSANYGLSINVTSVNDIPVITGQQSLTTLEDTPITLLLSQLVVSDPDNSYPTDFTLLVSNGANYTVAGNVITPSSNFNGTLTVPVRVNDGSANSSVFNATVNVTSVNDLPIISGQVALTVNEDQALPLVLSNLTVTDADTPGSSLSLQVLPGTNYTFASNTITPALNFNGTLQVNVVVNDGIDNSAVFPVQVQVISVNDQPIAISPPTTNLQEDDLSVIEIDLPLYFSDVEQVASSLTYSLVSFSNASFFDASPAIALGKLTFKMKPNVSGNISIVVKAVDAGSLFVQNSFSVSIAAINDPPSFGVISNQSVNENVSEQLIAVNAISKGPQESDQTLNLIVTSDNPSLLSSLSITPSIIGPSGPTSATLRYTVKPNAFGLATITVIAVDNGAAEPLPNSNIFSQKFTIEVIEINAPPTITPMAALRISEDAPMVPLSLEGITAGDGENQVLTVTVSNTNTQLFEMFELEYTSPNTTGVLKLKPAANKFGEADVTIVVRDNGSNAPPLSFNTTTISFHVTVDAVNDQPQFLSIPVTTGIVSEVYNYDILLTDVENDAISLEVLSKPEWLSLLLIETNKWKLKGTPSEGTSGEFSISLKASDYSGVAVLQNYVLKINARPLLTALTISLKEDVAHRFSVDEFSKSFSDPELQALSEIQILKLPARGTLYQGSAKVSALQKISVASLKDLVYIPAPDYFGKDTLYWNGSDGQLYSLEPAYVGFKIDPVNDPPVIKTIETDTLVYYAGRGLVKISEKFTIEDVDNDSLKYMEIAFRKTGFRSSLDVLTFENTPDLTSVYDAQAGILSISGKAPVMEYMNAFRSVNYKHTNAVDPMEEVKIISVVINDGESLSQTKDRFISLKVQNIALDIPKAFTPADDGSPNNTWNILYQGNLPSIFPEFRNSELTVFNDKGFPVFKTIGFEKEWDGKVGGDFVPAGSYFYTIDLKLATKKTFKGTVTVLR